jgi:membrane protein DedA with SNARE-associated domain/membrane-associated phospholipid phosphatase
MLENLIEDFAHSLGDWAYLFVALMATGETAAFLGFILPGEFTIILGGVLAGEGTLSIQLLIGIVWASIVLGDSIGFMLGRRLGREFFVKHGHFVRLNEERIQRVEDYFHRHGGKTIFFGRWVGFVRPLMPFTAGASGLPYRRFLPYDVLSAGLFGTFFCLLGYIFWNNFDRVTAIVGRGALGLGIAAAILVGAYLAFKRLRDPVERARFQRFVERQAERPVLKPLASVLQVLWHAIVPVWRYLLGPLVRALGPPLRFLGQRLTPGGLGIELTTLLAITAVSLYVFIAYTDVISADPSTTAGDRTAIDVARDIETGFLTAVAKAVTVFGKVWVTSLLIAAAALTLLMRRRSVEAIVLVAGFAVSQPVIYITKDAVDRPRPPDPLIDTDGWSFPSGHATTSVAYVALAVILARSVRSRTARTALIVAGVAITALIGFSRVYLRAHFLSDVNAGWALGLVGFSLCGALALVVSYLRNNATGSDGR